MLAAVLRITRVFCLEYNTSSYAGLDNKGGELYGQANQIAHEAIQALRTVHSYNLQSRVASLYRSMLSGPQQQSNKNALRSGAAFGFSQCVMFGVYALAFWYGGILVEDNEMNLEQMLKVFFAILLATMGISQAQVAFPDVAKGKKAVARVFRGAYISACFCSSAYFGMDIQSHL
jgi:ATP-binding cassette, subfamily B (MDR/TAP), member 1